MINQHTITSKKTIILLGMVIVAFSVGLHQVNETIAQETSEPKFISAENIAITAIFDFYEGQEVSSFEVFRQTSGFDKEEENPQFTLERIVGNTPLLHKAVDEHHKYSDVNVQFDWKFFDVKVIISQEGTHLRAFDYMTCQVSDYRVFTFRDPNESWTTSQGFATADVIDFVCDGYKPLSPTYEEMKSPEKAKTVSSLDLKQQNFYGPP